MNGFFLEQPEEKVMVVGCDILLWGTFFEKLCNFLPTKGGGRDLVLGTGQALAYDVGPRGRLSEAGWLLKRVWDGLPTLSPTCCVT